MTVHLPLPHALRREHGGTIDVAVEPRHRVVRVNLATAAALVTGGVRLRKRPVRRLESRHSVFGHLLLTAALQLVVERGGRRHEGE